MPGNDNQASAQVDDDQSDTTQTMPSSNTGMYIGIGIAVVAAIVVVIFLLMPSASTGSGTGTGTGAGSVVVSATRTGTVMATASSTAVVPVATSFAASSFYTANGAGNPNCYYSATLHNKISGLVPVSGAQWLSSSDPAAYAYNGTGSGTSTAALLASSNYLDTITIGRTGNYKILVYVGYCGCGAPDSNNAAFVTYVNGTAIPSSQIVTPLTALSNNACYLSGYTQTVSVNQGDKLTFAITMNGSTSASGWASTPSGTGSSTGTGSNGLAFSITPA